MCNKIVVFICRPQWCDGLLAWAVWSHYLSVCEHKSRCDRPFDWGQISFALRRAKSPLHHAPDPSDGPAGVRELRSDMSGQRGSALWHQAEKRGVKRAGDGVVVVGELMALRKKRYRPEGADCDVFIQRTKGQIIKMQERMQRVNDLTWNPWVSTPTPPPPSPYVHVWLCPPPHWLTAAVFV